MPLKTCGKMNKADVLSYVAAMKERLAGTPDFDIEMKTDDASDTISVWSRTYPNTQATFDLGRNRVTASSGSRPDAGALNELLNNETLVGNATYIIDGHFVIRTDDLGRPCRFRVSYNKTWSVLHGDRPTQPLGKGAEDGDQAGHVIAASLRGPHERGVNIVPMPWQLNERWYRYQEVFLASCLHDLEESADEDWFLEVRIDVSYEDERPLRPDMIRLEADVDNGKGYYARLSTECIY